MGSYDERGVCAGSVGRSEVFCLHFLFVIRGECVSWVAIWETLASHSVPWEDILPAI